MYFRYLIPLAALNFLLTSTPLLTAAQPARSSLRLNSERAEKKLTGILADRIPARLLPKWRMVERLAFAEDKSGQPLHPTLRSLWEWIDSSGHAVYIELIGATRISSSTAGNFSLEKFDATGERHVAVIKLFLSNIDQAFVGASVARPDGFIPFQGLKKEERYAEVIGHEMAHAVDILADLEKARQVEEIVEQTNEILLDQNTQGSVEALTATLQQRVDSRDSLLHYLEKRAEKAETIIWQELTASQAARGRTPESAIAHRD